MAEGENRVNLQYPDQSLLLTKPLLEDPPDHPNAAFQSTADPNYVLVKSWIEQGAPAYFEEPPPIVEPVDFAAQVYPLFQQGLGGRGCTACHNAVDLSGNLDLTGGADAVYLRLADYGYYNVNYPGESLLLTAPMYGPDVGHPVRVFANDNDPDYQTIYQWVLQGALYDIEIVVDPNLPTNVDFVSDVWPHFGAKGCTGCHGGNTPSANLNLQDSPQNVANNIAGVVVAYDPDASYILQKPYAGNAGLAHNGGKPIPNDQDPMYRYLAGWIAEGANFVAPTPIDFETQVVPLFSDNTYAIGGQTCVDCHGNSGGISLDGTPDEIYDELRVEQAERAQPNDPDNSLIITKVLATFPDVNHNGGKRVNNQTYNYYIYIARWLYEGGNRN
jgi:mono/diheme cytochrome c family protein